MNIIEKNSGSITLVSLIGELDAATAPDVQSRLLQFMQEGKKFMVLDFSKTTYLASAGMRVLLSVAKRAENLDGQLYLAAMSPTINDILKVTGFLPYFKAFGTVEEAAAAMESN